MPQPVGATRVELPAGPCDRLQQLVEDPSFAAHSQDLRVDGISAFRHRLVGSSQLSVVQVLEAGGVSGLKTSVRAFTISGDQAAEGKALTCPSLGVGPRSRAVRGLIDCSVSRDSTSLR